MLTYAAIVIVPDYAPREKHPTIFKTFDSINSGEAMTYSQ